MPKQINAFIENKGHSIFPELQFQYIYSHITRQDKENNKNVYKDNDFGLFSEPTENKPFEKDIPNSVWEKDQKDIDVRDNRSDIGWYMFIESKCLIFELPN